MTVFAAVNVGALDADIVMVGAAIAPPFSWSQQADHRRAHRNREMGRSSFSADVNGGMFRQRAETLQ